MPALLAALVLALGPTHAPSGFRVLTRGPSGGEIWRGAIPGATRASMIYVPPGYSGARRYRVVYLLAGMPGSPRSYVRSLSLASVADTLVSRRLAAPFVAVGGSRRRGPAATTKASGPDRGSDT